MNKNTISTIAILLVLIVGQGAIILYDSSLNDIEDTGTSYTVLSRVNTEGSGLYIDSEYVTSAGVIRNDVSFYNVDSSDPSNPFFYTDKTNEHAWVGLVMGTPGTTSIQHIYLQQIVEATGLSFIPYTEGADTSISCDCVYYVSSVTNASIATSDTTTIDGGILWEPQYSMIITVDKFDELALTGDFYPNHTCCVLAGATKYINNHADVTQRFLAAYVKAVDWMELALDDTTSEEYSKLVEICSKYTTGISNNIIMNALSNIIYTYGDDDGKLTSLKADVADLVQSLNNLGNLKVSLNSLGFSKNDIIASEQFANKFVDDSYLSTVTTNLASDEAYYYSSAHTTIAVAAITGDIHQIGFRVAAELGYFDECGINIVLVAETNGAGVATALQNGEANFGFIGAPPATITSINSKLISE